MFATYDIFATRYGGLAQLARALAWHARGHRFDSDILHLIKKALQKFVKPFLFQVKHKIVKKGSKLPITKSHRLFFKCLRIIV